MRRLLAALAVSAGLTGVIIVLPVFGSSGPEPVPVETFTHELAMGSLSTPAPGVELRDATTVPVAGVPEGSPVLTLSGSDTRNFSLVGVTWSHDPAVTDTVVQIRARDDRGEWGAWTVIETESVDQRTPADGADMPRGGTAPLWTGPSTGIQAELVTRSGAAPTDVRLDLVDPGTSPADAALGPADIQDTADAATAMPHVYSRAQWGADEGIRTWGPEYASTIKAATVHHTADSNSYTIDQVPAIMRSIYRYHAVSLGWGDIGYNVVVDKFGRLWEGRSGGLASTVVGAHAGGFNTGTFGVSMLGNYDTAETTQPMVDSVSAIIAWKFALYGVDPRASTTLVSGGGGTSRYAKGTSVTLPTIFGHRDVGSTACPGRYGYARMGEIRDKVSTTLGTVVPLIQQRYQFDSGARDLLGPMTTTPTRTPDGVGAYAHYDRGSIYASYRTAAHVIRGPIRDRWAAAGWERGALGYPVGDTTCGLRDGGCFQHFEGGSVYWSPATGARIVSLEIRDRWAAAGWENGALGYPTTDVTALPGGGRFVHFERGSVYWSPATGARIVSGVVRDRWAASGWENGPLGYPVSDVTRLADGGMFAHFERGSVYWSSSTGARMLLAPVRDRWAAAGWEAGALGYPVADQVATPGAAGQVVRFQRGWIYWSAAGGAWVVGDAVRDAWLAAGGDGGDLGMPTADAASTPDGLAQFAHFQGGSLYLHRELGTRVVPRDVVLGWQEAGGPAGPLGYPIAEAVSTSDGVGVVMSFQGGEVYAASGAGGHALHGPVRDRYSAAGGPDGELGYPTTGVRTLPGGGAFAHFEGGSVYWTQATGARIVSGPVRDRWAAAGWETGVLGFPTTDVLPLSGGGRFAHFEGGSVYWTQATGARIVSGPVRDRWAGAGWETGALGYPTTDVRTLPGGGAFAHFEGGSVYWTQATGARIVSGPVRDRWAASGWETGVLGFPTTDVLSLAGGGRFAHFQHGSVYWTQATGARLVRGPIRDAWAAAGWETGRLGYPTADPETVPGGTRQTFQGGTITSVSGRTTVSYR